MSVPPDHVYRLSLGGVNAYLVDDDGVTLVDAGPPWAVGDLRTRLADAGYRPEDVDRVLLTHYDPDHVGGLSLIVDDDTALDGSDVEVYMADPDARYLVGRDRPSLRSRKGVLQRAAGRIVDAPEVQIYRVEDGREIGPFVAHRTPGHTRGHVAYVHGEFGVAFVGDLLRESGGRLRPPTRLFSRDRAENDRSVRCLAEATDPETVAPGHGDPVSDPDALDRAAGDS
ncbi:MBL fold hydrolase [Halobacteriales archaeon QS_6_71_20]|nr:MAG: MBL fold hydrolase [Halobacteriales archaeon QS_6_71_20]